jgi:ABC-type oligopeptide transport system substrate-binding subunit
MGSDIEVARNVFSGLFRLDDALNLKPEIAEGMPEASTDKLTLTIHLRRGVRFSNGDPVTAGDVAYSWNRAAAVKGTGCVSLFLVQGCFDVLSGKAVAISGLAVKDDYTLLVRLMMPAQGSFLMMLDRPSTWIVDRKVIQALGDPQWSRTADGLVGTGPFRMKAWTRGRSLEFQRVPGWWGGSTGTLLNVQLEIVDDAHSRFSRYQRGDFDLLGYAGDPQVASVDPSDVRAMQRDPQHSGGVKLVPQAGTTWVQYNFASGPFAGLEEGKLGRLAFSIAIDRSKVVAAACEGGIVCQVATGGLISKGLRGYLGDGADDNAKFDPIAARRAYETWDPDRSKVKGLAYVYNSTPQNQLVAESLRAQWKENLGVTVALQPVDGQTFFTSRSNRAYALFREFKDVSLDHPAHWYGGIYFSPPPECGCGYSNPEFTNTLLKTLAIPVDQAMPDYARIGRMLIDEAAYAALFYELKTYVIKPYMRGVGGNALYDYLWASAQILSH